MKEQDLYLPVKRFLEGQGYEVKGEVGNCDVVAVRGEEDPVVVELKLGLNLMLLLQAVDRLVLTEHVYIGVPASNRTFKTQRKRMLRLLRMLGLGLLLVDDEVEVVLDPGPYAGRRRSKGRSQRLLKEFEKRVGDPNLGGSSTHEGRVTAYRQRAITIARHLHDQGPTKASVLAKALQDPEARKLLYRDVYGWFDRLGDGIYELSPRGRSELQRWV